MKASRIAIYPTSANPPTLGHADIVRRTAKHFEHLYWAAAVHPAKNYVFSPEERISMMQEYIKHDGLENVTAVSFSGSTARYAQSKDATVIIKGLRSIDDFQAEFQQATGNRGIAPEVETFCLFGSPDLFMVSSTLVREIAFLNEDIGDYVLPTVAEMVYASVRNHKKDN